MDEIYISQWDALNCFEDWEDAHGNLYYAYEDRTYQRIEELSPADVIPVEWIESQADSDKWNELIKRWNEYKEECK